MTPVGPKGDGAENFDGALRKLLRDKAVRLSQVHDTSPLAAKLLAAVEAIDEAERLEIAARPDPATCLHNVFITIEDRTHAICKHCKSGGHVGNWLQIITSQRDAAIDGLRAIRRVAFISTQRPDETAKRALIHIVETVDDVLEKKEEKKTP